MKKGVGIFETPDFVILKTVITEAEAPIYKTLV